jgi:hypothetical protein
MTTAGIAMNKEVIAIQPHDFKAGMCDRAP